MDQPTPNLTLALSAHGKLKNAEKLLADRERELKIYIRILSKPEFEEFIRRVSEEERNGH